MARANHSRTLRTIAVAAAATLALASAPTAARASEASQKLEEARALYQSAQYFQSARYAFAANNLDPGSRPAAYAWMTLGLLRAGLPQSASYFFIKTLQTGDKPAIRSVLAYTEPLLVSVGADVLRKYLIRHTSYEDYDPISRSAYLYALGKDALLDGKHEKAAGYLSGMSPRSPLWPFALQLRGTASTLLGLGDAAIRDFRACASGASDYASRGDDASRLAGLSPAERATERKRREREAQDLEARCQAGEARVLYEQGKFGEAEIAYDRIPKKSFVWTDILFEQAWNGFAKDEYNRALGKLVSYKSPALGFVFNSEVDVLRAQSYLALCLYADANEVINDFNARYSKVGETAKRFIEQNQNDLGAFHDLGKAALRGPLHTANGFHRMVNRFVRGPYFQNLVAAEAAAGREARRVRALAGTDAGQGFAGFVEQVLRWRAQSSRGLGGAFVKNSLIDHYQILIGDFEKIAFIKLEMLSRAKDKLLLRTPRVEGRVRGSREPRRRDDQYRWGFNGEFWNDELGDYVFGLESECQS